MSPPPKVFISYSHDDPAHKDWVKGLATFLRANGVDAILDQWDLTLGSDLTKFMEHGLSKSERVLIISTDNYIEKADSGNGGVGYEKMIASTKILANQDTTKFIPIVRNATRKNKLPVFMGSRLYIDLTGDNDNEKQRIELLKEIHKEYESKPQIGANPFSLPTSTQTISTNNDKKVEKPSLNGIDSTVFFARRFSSAFPGVRGIKWFDRQDSIEMRLCKLLAKPLEFENASPIWWWRDGNLQIQRFKSLGSGLYLMDSEECKITKIAAVNAGNYTHMFVYVETEKMEETGLYPDTKKRIQYSVEQRGYCSEEYGLYKNETMVTRAEYDDNAAVINDELVELGADVELRVRYITPYNFVIASNGSPINNVTFDQKLEELLNAMLNGDKVIDDLSHEIQQLPKKQKYR
ncbi:toll/interleukin-1 receptor domain-containing protein [Myxococcota bacterium]|nr:toll/interleukin-1 receptor domain-containing protein [Myxococcota bacterium]